jgi:hypothetical protein
MIVSSLEARQYYEHKRERRRRCDSSLSERDPCLHTPHFASVLLATFAKNDKRVSETPLSKGLQAGRAYTLTHETQTHTHTQLTYTLVGSKNDEIRRKYCMSSIECRKKKFSLKSLKITKFRSKSRLMDPRRGFLVLIRQFVFKQSCLGLLSLCPTLLRQYVI